MDRTHQNLQLSPYRDSYFLETKIELTFDFRGCIIPFSPPAKRAKWHEPI